MKGCFPTYSDIEFTVAITSYCPKDYIVSSGKLHLSLEYYRFQDSLAAKKNGNIINSVGLHPSALNEVHFY